MIYHISMWQQNMYGVADKFAEGMFTAAGFVAAGTLEGLIVKAVVARAGTAAGRVFWSGFKNPQVVEAATEFATKNGMVTLNMTRTGKVLTKLEKLLPSNISNKLWQRASARFTKGADETVHVFQDAKSLDIKSTWGNIEFPILKQKNVKIIFHSVE